MYYNLVYYIFLKPVLIHCKRNIFGGQCIGKAICMKLLLPKLFKFKPVKIPAEYHDDFYREIAKENYNKLSIISISLFIIELLLSINHKKIYKVGDISYLFICCHVLFIPIILYIKNHVQAVKLKTAQAAAYIYCICVLVFGAGLALYYQNSVDMVHMYVMAVFGVPNFVFIRPRNCAIMLISIYALFAVALPYFQSDVLKIWVILPNTLLANVFALILNSILFRSRIFAFMNKTLLRSQKNLLEELAQKDQMTGLFNHDVTLKKLESELNLARKIGHSVSLIISDIDYFKNINDRHGHLYGDEVIKTVAQTIKNTVRSTDIVGRYGGDEFIIILPNTDYAAANALAERICRKIMDMEIKTDMQISISCGVNEFSGEMMNEFIIMTDKKLYEAKKLRTTICES